MQSRIEEIQSFIDHNDYSLAVRRMLDVCLDSDNNNLLYAAIQWSKNYHAETKKGNDIQLSNNFFDEAKNLLQQLQQCKTVNNTTHTLIKVNNISKTYSKGNFSLKPISLEIKSSDVLGIVGENGNGKTTLLRCMAGQLCIDNGDIFYANISKPDYYAIKHSVAFIPQRIPKWYGLLKDNLHFSAALNGVHGKQNELMVDFMLERLNLTDYAMLTWSQISSGYRTRFEIARILLQNPSLLILDEPLANLDINAQQTILTDLRYMAKSTYNPMGIVLSSQQLHEVEKVADTVLFIKQGSCLFRTGDTINNIDKGYAVEIETTTERNIIVQILGDDKVHVQFNGGFYTITSTQITANEIIATLIQQQVPITYFRDITHSTKRYFN